MEKQTKCPMLLAAWITKYGNYNSDSLDVHQYCKCGDDCELFDRDSKGCSLKRIADIPREISAIGEER